MKLIMCYVLLAVCANTGAKPRRPIAESDESMHSINVARTKRGVSYERKFERTNDYWRHQAQSTLNAKLHQQINTNRAKNVILFLGDGMSFPTLAAARAYMGQLNGEPGEQSALSFEAFPHTGLSKTYCVDSQVADSACSATAYLCGVKGNIGTIGVNGNVPLGDWKRGINATHHVSSIARWSQLKNKRTGIVTTTRVTHATPAGAFANVGDRYWESDHDLRMNQIDPALVPDIARQLIESETGSNFNVIMGGGRKKLLPSSVVDEEGYPGERADGRNLIKEWKQAKAHANSAYVWNRDQLLNVSRDTDYLLGLFESSHCVYNLQRTDAEPTFAEMIESAIQVLSKGEEGFFLLAEGGRIDHAHHYATSQKALDETVEFSKAVQRAVELTSEEDTLIVVTADHGHTMSYSGYASRGTDILGIAGTADDKLPYSILTYANGPGYRPDENGHRYDISTDDTHTLKYRFPSIAPLDWETHGGEDVGIFARGPWSHLFNGVMEENAIAHIMAFASCVGDGLKLCDD